MVRALFRKIVASAMVGPICQARDDSGERAHAYGVEPNRIRPPFWRMSETPSVTINWPKCPSSRLPTVLRPETLEIQPTMQQRAAGEHHWPGEQRGHERAGIRPEQHAQPEATEDEHGDMHHQHQQFALGEVDHFHDAEDQP